MKKSLAWAFLWLAAVPFLGAGTIRVLAPSEGESLVLNSSFTVRWEAADVHERINVVLMRDGAFVGRIATRLPSDARSFDWRVGETAAGRASAGSGYRIRVVEAGGAGALGHSAGTFSLVPLRGTIPGPREMRPVEPAPASPTPAEPCDYTIASLAFKDFRGNDILMVNGERFFPYNGVLTPGTAVVKVRWNRNPASPPDPPCDAPVEIGLRYLADRSLRRIILGSFYPGPFGPDATSEIRAPFTLRAGEESDTKINIDARLLPQRAGCDGNPRNNSLAYDLKLHSYESAHDLQVHIGGEFTLKKQPYDPHHPSGQHFRINGSFSVRDFPRGPAEPVTDIRCKWTILRWYPAFGRFSATTQDCCGYVTVASVDSSKWTSVDFEGVFWMPDNYWEDAHLLVVIDCDNKINDIDRANNRRDRTFRLQ